MEGVVHIGKEDLRDWWKQGTGPIRLNQRNEEQSLIPMGLIVPICKIMFCSTVCFFGFQNNLPEVKGRKPPCAHESCLGGRNVA